MSSSQKCRLILLIFSPSLIFVPFRLVAICLMFVFECCDRIIFFASSSSPDGFSNSKVCEVSPRFEHPSKEPLVDEWLHFFRCSIVRLLTFEFMHCATFDFSAKDELTLIFFVLLVRVQSLFACSASNVSHSNSKVNMLMESCPVSRALFPSRRLLEASFGESDASWPAPNTCLGWSAEMDSC